MTQIQDIQGRVNSTLYTVFSINWTLNALLLRSTLLYSAMPSLAPCFEYSQPYSYVIFSNIGEQGSRTVLRAETSCVLTILVDIVVVINELTRKTSYKSVDEYTQDKEVQWRHLCCVRWVNCRLKEPKRSCWTCEAISHKYDLQRNDEEERWSPLTQKIHLPWLHPRLREPGYVRCGHLANDNRSLY